MHLCQIALIDLKAIKFVRASSLIQLYVIVIYLLKVTVSRICLHSTNIYCKQSNQYCATGVIVRMQDLLPSLLIKTSKP